jgi:hypothetical protein
MNSHEIEDMIKALDKCNCIAPNKIETVREVLEKFWSNQIALVWGVEDVQEVRRDLTKQQCREVLREVLHDHNADIGVNWETLKETADHMFPDEEIH